MRDLVIFGTGGFAREVHQIAKDINAISPTWNMLGFLDGNSSRHGAEVHGLPVLGDAGWLATHTDVHVVVAIGTPSSKRKVVQQLLEAGHNRFATLVHPKAWIGDYVSIGDGTIICAGTHITTDVTIGNHVIINLCCTIGHDAILEDYVSVLPSVNVSGNVRLGEGSDIGTGSQIIQGLTVGRWSVVGAGAVVVKDLPPNVTAVGAPAKPIKERPEGWQLS